MLGCDMTTAAQIYSEAASVRNQTGVDPAIIATIAQTESDVSKSPWTLGITHAASKGGAGSAGGWLPSPNTYGGTQPSGFWAYTNGADAAQAFANYINAYQPNLAPLLNNADAFFNPTGPLLSSSYYVPTAGESSAAGSARQATINYYARWYSMAQSFPQDVTGSGPGQVTYPPGVTNPGGPPDVTGQVIGGGGATGTTITSGASSASSSGQSFTLVPGFGAWPGIHVSFGFLWAALFLLGGVAAIITGLLVYFHKQVGQVAGKAASVAAAAAV
jgi:hypothetical protein